MRAKLTAALTSQVPRTLLMLWCAPSDADPSDPAVWRAASPHWSTDREQLIASKYAAALAGEVDPQADDPDPMAGFVAQYLNVWRLGTGTGRQRGNEVVEAASWGELADEVPLAPPDAAAIESWFGPASLALAWRTDGGRVVVSVTDHPDLASARADLDESGFAGTTMVGSSLATDPALRGLTVAKGEGRVLATAQALARLLAEDALRHDGGDHLTGQVLALRTMPGSDGPRLVSSGRADAVKAAVWAVQALRSKRDVGRPRILTASA